jgi:hypothetical protein
MSPCNCLFFSGAAPCIRSLCEPLHRGKPCEHVLALAPKALRMRESRAGHRYLSRTGGAKGSSVAFWVQAGRCPRDVEDALNTGQPKDLPSEATLCGHRSTSVSACIVMWNTSLIEDDCPPATLQPLEIPLRSLYTHWGRTARKTVDRFSTTTFGALAPIPESRSGNARGARVAQTPPLPDETSEDVSTPHQWRAQVEVPSSRQRRHAPR